jgi:hypothetical protein
MKKYLITKDDVAKALADTMSDIGNEVLYNLCVDYPHHKKEEHIFNKIWLIGRSYAATLNRHKKEGLNLEGDAFDEFVAREMSKKPEIDDWLDSLKGDLTLENAKKAIEIHSNLVEVFGNFSKYKNPSLASKYLHFHRPNLFFIYDSRANQTIRKITKGKNNELKNLLLGKFNPEYADFYRRCLWLQEQQNLWQKPGKKFSPRDVDKILLYEYKELHKIKSKI